jgi:hypothetical protein
VGRRGASSLGLPAPATPLGYAAIPAGCVPRAAREAAAVVLAHCAAILRLDPAPGVQWYAPTETGCVPVAFRLAADWRGAYRATPAGARIELESTADVPRVVRTLGHEARHAWQVQGWGWRAVLADPQAYERDADAFADAVAAWWDVFGRHRAGTTG